LKKPLKLLKLLLKKLQKLLKLLLRNKIFGIRP
jgi:hypothetical protein